MERQNGVASSSLPFTVIPSSHSVPSFTVPQSVSTTPLPNSGSNGAHDPQLKLKLLEKRMIGSAPPSPVPVPLIPSTSSLPQTEKEEKQPSPRSPMNTNNQNNKEEPVNVSEDNGQSDEEQVVAQQDSGHGPAVKVPLSSSTDNIVAAPKTQRATQKRKKAETTSERPPRPVKRTKKAHEAEDKPKSSAIKRTVQPLTEEELERFDKATLRYESEKLRERENHLVQWENKTKEALIDLLRKQAAREKQDARNKMMADCVRLGQITFERRGGAFVETWQEGCAFTELKHREKVVHDLKEDIKKIKKEKEDVHTFQAFNLKKEETELLQEEARINMQKDVHIRELKRIMDEDRSRFNHFPILKDQYLLLSLLGKGGFSEVYKAFDLVNIRTVACKIHQLNPTWNEAKKLNYTKHAIREFEIQKSIVHQKIVGLYDVFDDDSSTFCTVLEYCDGGDLDAFLKHHKMIPEKESKAIIQQILQGLRHLNEQKRQIIHYDLKPGNILFHQGEVKITDFGLSKIMEENSEMMELTSQGAGTYWYLPPECFEQGREPPKISSKVDVWSLGVMYYQMLYGKKPFGNDLSQPKLFTNRVISSDLQVEFPPKPLVSKETKDFIRRCLTPRQELRPDVLQCSQEDYWKIKVLKVKSRKDSE